MGGGATIGLSVINCNSGANGRYRISGVIAAIFVLIFVLGAYPLIEAIPSASLVGVMVIVVFSTFDFQSLGTVIVSFLPQTVRNHHRFDQQRKIKRTDAITIVLVTVITLVMDLFIAVTVGILFTAAAYAWDVGQRSQVVAGETYDRVTTVDVEDEKTGLISIQKMKVKRKTYRMKGPLFFGSAMNFVNLFDVRNDPQEVEIDFFSDGSEINDYSAVHALNTLSDKYKKYGKVLFVRKLKGYSRKVIHKASKLATFNIIESPQVKTQINQEDPPKLDLQENETKDIELTIISQSKSKEE